MYLWVSFFLHGLERSALHTHKSIGHIWFICEHTVTALPEKWLVDQEGQEKLCDPTPHCDKSCVTLPDGSPSPSKDECPRLSPLVPCLKMVLCGEEEKLLWGPSFRPHRQMQSFCTEGGTRNLLSSVFIIILFHYYIYSSRHEVTLI